MARRFRVVVPEVVHHVVARGVGRMKIFRHGFDKDRYLKRAADIAQQESVLIHGYCLMENHIHFLLTPATSRGLARFFSRLHTWWAMFMNKKLERTGHLFQSRYFSSPLSECHYWAAIRYVELNAVRARLAARAEDWKWSSARDHLRLRGSSEIVLHPVPGRKVVALGNQWREMLEGDEPKTHIRFRRALRSSAPCGPPEFVRDLETRFRRTWSHLALDTASLTGQPA